MMDRIYKQNGSTLIEVLVSMIVMLITVLGGMALYFNASELQKMAIHKKMATELANIEMEKYRDQACSSITSYNWTDYTIGGLNPQGSDSKGIKVDVTSQTGYCEVEVNIKWNEVGQMNRDFEVKLITYVAP